MTDIWHMDNRGQGVLNINAAMKTPTGEALLKHSKYREEIMNTDTLHDQAQHLADTMSPYQLAKLYLEKDQELVNTTNFMIRENDLLKIELNEMCVVYDRALAELETYYE